MTTVACDGCGEIVDEKDITMGRNVGFGPEYYCFRCKPPASAREAIASIDRAMLDAEPE